jgi:RNA polymerase sigma-70 factor (ECF subfamily)
MRKGERLKPYLDRLYGYAISLVRDRERAKDLVQESALRAMTAKNIPADERAYRAWLFRILRNIFLDQARREKVAAQIVESEPEPETEFWQGEERFIVVLTVRIEIEKLPPAKREIITLIDIVGFSYAEAAELLNVPVGTVMSRLSRARRSLLDAISASNVRPLPVRKKKRLS